MLREHSWAFYKPSSSESRVVVCYTGDFIEQDWLGVSDQIKTNDRVGQLELLSSALPK